MAKVHNISIVGNEFNVDGQPLHIMSGSLHYFRVPAAYWTDRLRKLKAAGLNTVSTYVEWSFHEPEERRYSFSGDHDIAQFVQAAAAEGLYVLLRPGPYICAERDLGGLPYWLLGKYPNIKLRTTDKDFIEETKTWMAKVFEQLSPFLFGNGGPIILVQVENEYGSYGSDMPYKEQIRDVIREHVGTNALLYTADGTYSSLIRDGAVPGTLTTINFGPEANIDKVFNSLRKYMPEGPLMNSEYYPGWLTHWTENFQGKETALIVNKLNEMMIKKINFNFYMFFGGTNFEFTAGANYDESWHRYQPDITSYDYDAPLSEAGDPTFKYYAIREVLQQNDSNLKTVPIPAESHKGNYGKVSLSRKISLLSPEGRSRLGKKYSDVTGSKLPTFESLRQRAGLMLYETTVNDTNGILEIKLPRDRVYVFVDKVFSGLINRMTNTHNLSLETTPGSVLSLLVENQGRINYGLRLHDYKGILGSVKFNNKKLDGKWTVTGYPLEQMNAASHTVSQTRDYGPVLYEGKLTLPEGQHPLDTFLDTGGWGKGYIWVNGHNLGRYWPSAGPQITLYVPGVWLYEAPAQNEVLLLELEKPSADLTIDFIDTPKLNGGNFAS
ncbi:beta-galactosidase-like isoform X2 [Hyposmocoma kahamanoa]|uniref:beta-galactosidase-like isoform X2 n=1 Tax=Hyposmocoma kahamanoa TaxID=1477025 RepID=UPI000E6D69E5|nr:beta-galactosidase-like isoform X2 [Hyposmocoma kahamanoa]